MTKPKQTSHTPGPWTSSKQGMNPSDYDLEIRTQDETCLVATVHQQNDTAIPNAQLIAAAPELLEALQEIEFLIADGKTDDAYILAQETIAKATGGAE